MDKKLFSFSFLISSFIYFSLVFSFVYFISKNQQVKNIDAMSAQTVVVEIETKTQTEAQKQEVVEAKNNVEKILPPQKEQIESKPNAQKLFSDTKPLFSKEPFKEVQRDDFARQIAKEDKKPEPQIQKKFEFIKEKRETSPDVSSAIREIESKKNQHSAQKNLSANNPDPYYSKIYELLNNRWNPSSLAQKLTSKVIVIINANGKFDYVIVQKSSNASFNNQLFLFLESQKSVVYPPFKDGMQTSIEVNFTSEGI